MTLRGRTSELILQVKSHLSWDHEERRCGKHRRLNGNVVEEDIVANKVIAIFMLFGHWPLLQLVKIRNARNSINKKKMVHVVKQLFVIEFSGDQAYVIYMHLCWLLNILFLELLYSQF